MSFSSEQIAQWIWSDIETTTSTNDAIKTIIAQTNKKNIVVSAKHQTGGRGRRGHKWQEIEGNLYFTYSLEILPQELSRIVCLVGLSLAKTVKKLNPEKKVQIKWPNDVFVEGKKLSGILLENVKDNLWAIGIGVNITGAPQLENSVYKATSLRECGIILDRIDFLRYYLKNFATDLIQYQQEGFQSLKKEWLNIALNYQKQITVKTATSEKKGIFLTIDDNGYLILKTNAGEERITAGDLFI